MERRLAFTLDDGHAFGGLFHLPDGFEPGRATVVVLGHGAANTMDHPLLVHLAEGLARSGIGALRFNFPYSAAGRPSPDPQARLEATWERVLENLRSDGNLTPRRIVAAGKSMAGRVASQMAAAGRLPVDALIFYGYPLHAPGKPEQRRDAHLPGIDRPMLFFEGTRDPFCRIELIRPVVKALGDRAALEEIPGGDHSFVLPKSEQDRQTEVYARILERSVAWLRDLPASETTPADG